MISLFLPRDWMQSGETRSLICFIVIIIKTKPHFMWSIFLIYSESDIHYTTAHKCVCLLIGYDACSKSKNIDLPSAWICPQTKKKKMFICTTHRLPHLLSHVRIAASWRWIWSIRSINRDYCNPRGQREGTGPLRVHTSHTQAPDKSVQELQTFGHRKL